MVSVLPMKLCRFALVTCRGTCSRPGGAGKQQQCLLARAAHLQHLLVVRTGQRQGPGGADVGGAPVAHREGERADDIGRHWADCRQRGVDLQQAHALAGPLWPQQLPDRCCGT